MVTRCISGAVLAIIAVVAMFVGGPLLAVLLLLTSMVAYRELTKALQVNNSEKGYNGVEIIGTVGILLYYLTV